MNLIPTLTKKPQKIYSFVHSFTCPDHQNFLSHREWELQVKSASEQLFSQLTCSVLSQTAVWPDGGKSKESSADLGKIVEGKKKRIEGDKEKSEKIQKSQIVTKCVGEKEQISRREKEEGHTVVKGRVE